MEKSAQNSINANNYTLSNYNNKCSSSIRGGLFKSCIGDLDANVSFVDDLYFKLLNNRESDCIDKFTDVNKFQSHEIISKLVIPSHSLDQLLSGMDRNCPINILGINNIMESTRSNRSHSHIGLEYKDTINYHCIPTNSMHIPADEPQHLIVMQHGYGLYFSTCHSIIIF